MRAREVPFDIANIPGQETGRIVSAEVAAALISASHRPLLVVGSEVMRDEFFVEKAIEMGEKGVAIAATGKSIRGFMRKGYKKVQYFNLHDITNRLRDPNWGGIDGNGNHDTVIFFGILYYYASQMLSCLKNFALNPMIRTISIDRYYHPNARFTFPNIESDEEYKKMIEKVVELVKR